MAKTKKKVRFHDPVLFALYLLRKHPKYAGYSGRKIKEDFPEFNMSVHKICELKSAPEFKDTVRTTWKDQIRDTESLDTLFWAYLMYYLEANFKQPNPSSKPLDILGWFTKNYIPKQGGIDDEEIPPEKQKIIDSFLAKVFDKKRS